MKRLSQVCSATGVVMVLAVTLAFWGCGKKQESAPKAPESPVQAQPSQLQPELDRLADLPYEHDPQKRPVLLSEAVTNRHDWLLGVLERGYVETGRTNKQWDALARQAFRAYADYSRVGATEARYASLSNAVITAITAGCDDPVIRYMRLRYGWDSASPTWQTFALNYLDIFRAIHASRHHPVLKFFVGYRAGEAARTADPNGNRSILMDLVTEELEDLVRDANAPAGEVFDPMFLWIDYSKAKGWADYVITNTEPNLKQYWGKEEAYFGLMGRIEINRAWDSRGNGFANSVSDQGWEGFGNHLDNAERLLTQAWQLNPSNAVTAYQMMRLELGQGLGRPRMEQWLHRAMALDPGYYEAAKCASYYLEPRWYGSEGDALEFARTCVTSTNWVGEVPLVLPDTHHSLAAFAQMADSPEYWQKPGVWEDVRDGYEKYFKLNPRDFGRRHNYARDAYLCGHYDAFLEQTRLFNNGTNYDFFGGKVKFEQMVAKASAAR